MWCGELLSMTLYIFSLKGIIIHNYFKTIYVGKFIHHNIEIHHTIFKCFKINRNKLKLIYSTLVIKKK